MQQWEQGRGCLWWGAGSIRVLLLGRHSLACLLPQSRSLSPSPLGSSTASTLSDRTGFSSQTAHGTVGQPQAPLWASLSPSLARVGG